MVLSYIFTLAGINPMLGYFLLVTLPLSWYSLGILKKDQVRTYMFYVGKYFSSRCSKIPYWEKYAEPIFIRQFAIIFTATNSFIEGMVSDNKNKEEIEEEMEEFKDCIEDDINVYKFNLDSKSEPKSEPKYNPDPDAFFC